MFKHEFFFAASVCDLAYRQWLLSTKPYLSGLVTICGLFSRHTPILALVHLCLGKSAVANAPVLLYCAVELRILLCDNEPYLSGFVSPKIQTALWLLARRRYKNIQRADPGYHPACRALVVWKHQETVKNFRLFLCFICRF